MSITDELRAVAAKTECANGRCEKLYRGDLDHIADRIDAEHEDAVRKKAARMLTKTSEYMNDDDLAEIGLVRLPVDADGVPIRVGDVMEFEHRGEMLVAPVDTIELSRDHKGYLWSIMVDHQCVRYSMSGLEMRHYKPPTVEDVLQEMLYKSHVWDGLEAALLPDLIAEYAAKLQLRGDAE